MQSRAVHAFAVTAVVFSATIISLFLWLIVIVMMSPGSAGD